jgi:hypothetical protein
MDREVYLEDVKRDGLLLEKVNEQDEEICLEVVKNNPKSLEYVEYQTKDVCLEAVKRDGLMIKLVKTQLKCLIWKLMNNCAEDKKRNTKYKKLNKK